MCNNAFKKLIILSYCTTFERALCQWRLFDGTAWANGRQLQLPAVPIQSPLLGLQRLANWV